MEISGNMQIQILAPGNPIYRFDVNLDAGECHYQQLVEETGDFVQLLEMHDFYFLVKLGPSGMFQIVKVFPHNKFYDAIHEAAEFYLLSQHRVKIEKDGLPVGFEDHDPDGGHI